MSIICLLVKRVTGRKRRRERKGKMARRMGSYETEVAKRVVRRGGQEEEEESGWVTWHVLNRQFLSFLILHLSPNFFKNFVLSPTFNFSNFQISTLSFLNLSLLASFLNSFASLLQFQNLKFLKSLLCPIYGGFYN